MREGWGDQHHLAVQLGCQVVLAQTLHGLHSAQHSVEGTDNILLGVTNNSAQCETQQCRGCPTCQVCCSCVAGSSRACVHNMLPAAYLKGLQCGSQYNMQTNQRDQAAEQSV